jgi:hypothetical protein
MADVAQQKKKTVRSRDFKTIFSNGIRMRVGDNDAGITFLIETDDENGTLIFEDQVQILMTPKTLKVLQMVLSHSISELERIIGPITLAPEKQAEIERNLANSSAKRVQTKN